MQENTVFVRKFNTKDISPINENEVWRYAGYFGKTDKIESELKKAFEEVKEELKDFFSYKVCFRRMARNCDDLSFTGKSKSLSRFLCDSDEVIIFAATVGVEIDRRISKLGRISPLKMTLANALGAERIEALCDAFCGEIAKKMRSENLFCTKRFSPGYGDLPLSAQKDFFALLDPSRKIGLSLNESLLMSPSKSVTAIFGLTKVSTGNSSRKCENCDNLNCEFRKQDTK